MNIHKNARLTPIGRERLVRQMLSGLAPEAAARAVGVSPRTAYKWLARFKNEGVCGLADRSSRPRRWTHLDGVHVISLETAWLASSKFHWDSLTPLPLALTDETSLFRQIARSALDLGSIPYVERFTFPSLIGLRPAIVANLGVTICPVESFPKDEVVVLGEAEGLPPLPKVPFFGYLRQVSAPRFARDFLESLKTDI